MSEYCPHGARWTTCPETHPPPKEPIVQWDEMVSKERYDEAVRQRDRAEESHRLAEAHNQRLREANQDLEARVRRLSYRLEDVALELLYVGAYAKTYADQLEGDKRKYPEINFNEPDVLRKIAEKIAKAKDMARKEVK